MTNAPASSAQMSPHRKRLIGALVVGTVLGLGLMVASLWVPALGWGALVAALTAAFVAAWSGLREFAEWREEASEQAANERSLQRARTQELHDRQRSVLAAVDRRVQGMGEELTSTRTALGASQSENSRLRGDNAALRTENTELRRENEELRGESSEDAEAENVVSLPRRGAASRSKEWAESEAPTVIDLQRLASPFVEEIQRRHAN